MNDAPGSGDAAGSRTPSPLARHIFTRIRLAAAFLTILPVAPADSAEPADIAASFGWFPLVGFVLGVTLCALDWSLAPILHPALRAVIVVAALTAVTGAIHLDGLADTADALGAGRDRTRALEILRDSRIGSFGAIALIFILTLKFVAIATADPADRRRALILAPGLGRWAMVAVSAGMDYLRPGGAGSALLGQERGGSNPRLATIIGLIGVAVFAVHRSLAAIVAAAALTFAMRVFYRRWLGGITGDLIGAAGEIVETAVMIALTC